MGVKREPEYRLQKRWQAKGFVLTGSREVINGKTFTQAHAQKIVKLGLAWKYLEVVESWNRADVKAEVKEAREATTQVDITEHTPVEGDGVDAETTVKKKRRKKKTTDDEATTDSVDNSTTDTDTATTDAAEQ